MAINNDKAESRYNKYINTLKNSKTEGHYNALEYAFDNPNIDINTAFNTSFENIKGNSALVSEYISKSHITPLKNKLENIQKHIGAELEVIQNYSKVLTLDNTNINDPYFKNLSNDSKLYMINSFKDSSKNLMQSLERFNALERSINSFENMINKIPQDNLKYANKISKQIEEFNRDYADIEKNKVINIESAKNKLIAKRSDIFNNLTDFQTNITKNTEALQKQYEEICDNYGKLQQSLDFSTTYKASTLHKDTLELVNTFPERLEGLSKAYELVEKNEKDATMFFNSVRKNLSQRESRIEYKLSNDLYPSKKEVIMSKVASLADKMPAVKTFQEELQLRKNLNELKQAKYKQTRLERAMIQQKANKINTPQLNEAGKFSFYISKGSLNLPTPKQLENFKENKQELYKSYNIKSIEPERHESTENINLNVAFDSVDPSGIDEAQQNNVSIIRTSYGTVQKSSHSTQIERPRDITKHETLRNPAQIKYEQKAIGSKKYIGRNRINTNRRSSLRNKYAHYAHWNTMNRPRLKDQLKRASAMAAHRAKSASIKYHQISPQDR